jgi:hypothetical protein
VCELDGPTAGRKMVKMLWYGVRLFLTPILLAVPALFSRAETSIPPGAGPVKDYRKVAEKAAAGNRRIRGPTPPASLSWAWFK